MARRKGDSGKRVFESSGSRMTIRVAALGNTEILTASAQFTPTASKKFALILLLAAERGRRVPRAQVHDLLFAGFEHAKARHALREVVYQLRLSDVDIEGNRHGLSIDPARVDCDWLRVTDDGRIDRAVLESIRNGFLPGYAPAFSEGFTEWLDSFRTTTSLHLVQTCLRIAETAKLGGDWRRAEYAARAALGLDPLNGHATLMLAEMLAIGGCATQAAELLDAYAAELGPGAKKVAIPVAALRRRIGEAASGAYRRAPGFAFAGREREMRILSDAFREAREEPRAVLLVGEAGIGKSRLANEFATRVGLEGCTVLRVAARPHDRRRPMGAFIDLVPQLLNAPGAIGASPVSMNWLRVLAGQASAEHKAESPAQADEAAYAITSALFDVIEATISESPLMIVVDDAQWVDDTSLELFRTALATPALSGLFVVIAARDDRQIYSTGSWGAPLLSCALGPLDTTITANLIGAELETLGDSDDSLRDWMAHVASGNPFYAESLVNHYRATCERFVVPPRLTSVVDQRIAAVSPEARDTLEAIVALGRHATISRVEVVLGEYGGALVRHTRELGHARLIVGDTEVAPSHSLVAESIQRNAVPFSQRLLYRRIAGVLESELDSHSDPRWLWECAEVWIAAGEPERATTMIATCAEHALSIGRAKEASELYFRAATLFNDSRGERYAEASIQAAVLGGEPDGVLRAIPALTSRVGKRIHDEIELSEIRARLWLEEDPRHRVALLVECFQDTSAPMAHRISAAGTFLSLCLYGEYADVALATVDSVAGIVDAPKTGPEEMRSGLILAGSFYSLLGDLQKVRETSTALIREASAARPDFAMRLLITAGLLCVRTGESEKALDTWQQAYAIARQYGLEKFALGLSLSMASQFLDLGDIRSAEYWLETTRKAQRAGDITTDRLIWEVAAEVVLNSGPRESILDACAQVNARRADEGSARSRRHANAFAVLASHLRGEPIDAESLIHQLTRFHIVSYETGVVADLEIAILVRILCEHGHVNTAQDQIRRYLTQVRLRGPRLRHSLLRAIEMHGLSRPFDPEESARSSLES